jgi:hypothetical protein
MTTTQRHPMIPVAEPRVQPDFYTPAEVDALFGVVRRNGPWPLVAAHHFSSTEEYLAIAGGRDRRPDAKLSDFTAPVFRGYLAKEGVALYDEIHDIYFGRKLLDAVKQMHGARYALAHHMLFNLGGPSRSFDAGHFDGGNWRGITLDNTPVWLIGVMAKSGLFDRWELKSGQVITYFYDSDVDGGFTYWPQGPDAAPRRLPAPFRNDALVTDNCHMYHRREGNGPRDRRDLPELVLESTLHAAGEDEWSIRTGEREIARFAHADSRALFHFTALAFDDLGEVDRYLDHSDDLTPHRALEILVDDLRRRGVPFTEPSDPLHDRALMAVLTETHAMSPASYPAEAPLEVKAA